MKNFDIGLNKISQRLERIDFEIRLNKISQNLDQIEKELKYQYPFPIQQVNNNNQPSYYNQPVNPKPLYYYQSNGIPQGNYNITNNGNYYYK